MGLPGEDVLHPVLDGFHRPVQRHAEEGGTLVGLMVVRPGEGIDAPGLAVAGSIGVLGRGVAGVGNLDAIGVQIADVDGAEVPAHPEGVRLDDAAPRRMDVFKLLAAGPVLHLRVGQQIFLVQAVDEVFVAIEVLLDAEEHVQADLLAFVPGVLKAGAVPVHPVLPVAGTGRSGIAAKEMIGDKDALIAPILIEADMLRAGGRAAGAALPGVHMGLVEVHGMQPPFIF